jgi:hypothetical protein
VRQRLWLICKLVSDCHQLRKVFRAALVDSVKEPAQRSSYVILNILWCVPAVNSYCSDNSSCKTVGPDKALQVSWPKLTVLDLAIPYDTTRNDHTRVITHMRHVLILVLCGTHSLHAKGLEMSMFALRIWRCMVIYIYICALCLSTSTTSLLSMIIYIYICALYHTHYARPSQAASQRTGAVDVRDADMAMY